MWGKKKQVEEPVTVDEVFDDLHAELDDIVVTAEQPEAEVPVDFEARVNELTVLLREAQERAAKAKLAVKPEGLSPFKTPFESKPAAVVERPRSLNRRITRVEVEAGESRIISQFEDNEPEEKKSVPAVWNLGYRLEELAEAVANILVDQETGQIAHEHEQYAEADHTHDPQDLTHDHDGVYEPAHDHPYAADDHSHPPQDLTHDHDEYFAKGGQNDDDGKPLPLPYSDGYSLGAALDAHTHDTTHDHDDEYIRKEAANSTYKDWLLKADGNKKNPDDFAPKHSHPYAASSHTHNYASSSHTHSYAPSNHTHSGGGGAVELKHGSVTSWESYHGTYGCGKWFGWYRRYDGYKAEATSSRKLSELGKVLFKCNSSGFENKVGQSGLLIGSARYDNPNNYPTVVMNIWKTTEQVVSGYVNITFEGTVAWTGDPSQTFQDAPSLYWTWVGDAK